LGKNENLGQDLSDFIEVKLIIIAKENE